MRLYVLIAIVLAAFAAGGASAWQVQNWRHDAQEKDRIEQEAKERGIRAQRGDIAAAGHEGDKRAIEIEYREITKEVERVVEKPVYRDVCLDDDGLRVLRSAIGGASAGQPARAVPGPERAR